MDMLIMQQKRSFVRSVAVCVFFLCAIRLSAEEPATSPLAAMSGDELIREANLILENEPDRALQALPYLETYLQRVADSDADRIRAMAQDVRMKCGTILVKERRLNKAAAYFRAYVDNRPALKWHEAMQYLSTTLLELGRYEDCVQVTTNALAGPPPDVREEIEEARQRAAADRSDPATAGAPEGYRFDEYGELVEIDEDEEAVAEAQGHPSGYELSDLLVLNMNLGKAYSEQGMQVRSIDAFDFVAERSDNPIHRGYALMQVIEGLIEKEDYDALTTRIARLYHTDARYDIRVNMALLKAAKALFDAEQYDSALPLFRMVLPREELIAHQSVRLWELRVEAGIKSPAEIPERYRTQMDETIFGKKFSTVPVEETWSEEEREGSTAEKPQELIELEELLRTLESLPPYENEAVYRTAYLYDEVNRPWEAARFFDRVYQADPDSDIGQRSFYDMVRILLDPLEQIEEVERRGFDYLARKKEGLVPRQILYLITAFYQQHDRMADIKTLLPYLESLVPTKDRIARKYECELWYMQAVTDVSLLNYEEAEAGFRYVLKTFPGSHQEENATYWHAVTLLFLEQYEQSLAELNAYLERYPDGQWVAGALFQSGTALFGLERYDEALERFTAVIENHPDSRVFPDACSLRGDIYGSRGLLDKAVQDYRTAFSAAYTHAQAKYATFQMAAVFEAEERYEKILAAVNDYLERYQAEADISMGVYWIGKTMLNQGRVDEAVETYFDAIAEYGDDLQQEGVDSIIGDLVRISKTRLAATQIEALRDRTIAMLRSDAGPVLRLRLRAMLAKMDGTEVALGAELLEELDTFEQAAPPVLAAICEASFARRDYSRAEELLDMFKRTFEESEFMRSAYKLRAFELFADGENEAVLNLIDDAQARYGTDYDVAWAQVMKGQVLSRMGRHDEAVKELKAVFNVVGWRGATYAEAAYRLAQAHEAAGSLLKAHGWYQRTYVQYKGYNQGRWAADAYLGSARCLQNLGRTDDARNTYRAMLFDKYVNDLPQADAARKALGNKEVQEIEQLIEAGVQTNINVTVESEDTE